MLHPISLWYDVPWLRPKRFAGTYARVFHGYAAVPAVEGGGRPLCFQEVEAATVRNHQQYQPT